MLGRVRELAVQYKNGTLSTSDKTSIENEVTQLGNEIARIGSDTKFNGITLLSGTPTVTFQVGADDSQTITVAGAHLFGAGSGYSVDSAIFTAFSTATIAAIDSAIQNVATARATFGAVQNRHRAHAQQPRHLRGEPHGVREPDPRRRHGGGDGALHEVPDPPAGRHLDARPGEHAPRSPCSACSAAKPR